MSGIHGAPKIWCPHCKTSAPIHGASPKIRTYEYVSAISTDPGNDWIEHCPYDQDDYDFDYFYCGLCKRPFRLGRKIVRTPAQLQKLYLKGRKEQA